VPEPWNGNVSFMEIRFDFPINLIR